MMDREILLDCVVELRIVEELVIVSITVVFWRVELSTTDWLVTESSMLEFERVLSTILDELMVDLLELLDVIDEFSILLRLMRDPIDVELEIVLFLTSELLIMERVILVLI